MRRLTVIRTALLAIVAIFVLASASAEAATWQGPATISEATVNAQATPKVALGRSGDAAVAWLDDAAPGGRLAMARKRAGGSWSAPVTVATPLTGVPVFAGVDGAGNITAAYPAGGTTSSVATWAATATAPTATPLPGNLTVTDLAVNAAGDAVIAGLTESPAGLTVGYRKGPAGAFVLKTYPYIDIGVNVTAARVAINASGSAVVAAVAGDSLRVVTRTALTDWPASAAPITPTTVTGNPSPGIDDAGSIVVAFARLAVIPILRAGRIPAGGSWQESGDLSSTAVGSSATSINLVVNALGFAAIVWLQTTSAGTIVQARSGDTFAGFLGGPQDLNDAGALDPVAAIGDDGTVAAIWERSATGGSFPQARMRTNGVWTELVPLGAVHPNATSPSLSTDGRGDFAMVTAPGVSTHPVVLSYYDAAPPAIPAPTVTGSKFIGAKLTFATTPTDAWSTAGTPTWTFGDGTPPATGASVTHTYTRSSNYAVHVSVTDSVGNIGGADFMVDVAVGQATLRSAKFSAKWKQSRLTGTLAVRGTVPFAGTYFIDVFKGRVGKFHFSVKLTDTDFSRTIRLPATFLPGAYRVLVDPPTTLVIGAQIDATLAAPPEGVVDVKKLSATRTGKAVRTIRASRSLFASFHFAALPKGGALKLTWYRTYRGKKTTLKSAGRKRVAKVTDSLALRGRRGTITAVLTRSGKIVAQSSVKAT